METFADLTAWAALCSGSMAFILVLLYARRTLSRAWLLFSLMIAVLALQALNIRLSALYAARIAEAGPGLSFNEEAIFLDFLVRQILGSLVNLAMLGLFPFLLSAFGLLGRKARLAMIASCGVIFVYQAVSLAFVFGHIREAGRLGELPIAGNILFIAYLFSCFLSLFLGRKSSTPMFRELLKGSLPLLFTIFPFLAADLFSIASEGGSGSFLRIGMILYFCFFFAYVIFHFFSIMLMEGRAARSPEPEPEARKLSAAAAARRDFKLSEREAEVLEAMLQGRTNLQIADSLCVSLATVKTHTNHIFQKTGAKNRLELFANLN